MSCRLGLWIGESFAEVRGLPTGNTAPFSVNARWFLPRRSLSDGLRDVLAAMGPIASDGGEFQFATTRVENTLSRRQGSMPALLTTAGFENWLRLRAPLATFAGSLHPQRAWLPIDSDQTFGITERIAQDGAVTKALQLEELELLVGKLQLLKVKTVAIAFLHSTANPSHELQAAKYLREHGFNVVCSHHFDEKSATGAASFSTGSSARFGSFGPHAAQNEVARWQRTVESAYAESAVQEELEQIRSALSSVAPLESWTISAWGANGLTPVTEATNAAQLRGGVEAALAASAGRSTFLHFGIEGFHLVAGHAAPSRVERLEVQPTRQIATSVWGNPSLGNEDRGYEPGPMLFGKSHQLTVLDVLFVRERMAFHVDGFSDLIASRSRPRILETILTLGKGIPDSSSSRIDSRELVQDLELSLIERIAAELAEALGPSPTTKDVVISGPLTPALDFALGKRRPDLNFQRDRDADWRLAAAVLSESPSNPLIESERSSRS